ncbi:MAG: hypothetical protein LBI84_07840 [Propionibacteriaceae bacterium]|nr:hypothetical protein [Propionibacteriaceae bacterium]
MEPSLGAQTERAGQPTQFMGMDLLLKVPTRHGWLWAYNEEHLAQLKALVAAKLRDDTPGLTFGSSWANRLPSWIVAAKNRDEIAKALAKMEKLLPRAPMA